MDYESKLSLVKYLKNPKMFKHLKNEVELMTYNARTPLPPLHHRKNAMSLKLRRTFDF